MGRVFNYKEKYPSKGKINQCAEKLASLLWYNFKHYAIIGSVAIGDYNVRSDIDTVVLYESHRDLAKLREIHHKFLSECNVCVEFAVFNKFLADTPFHRDCYSFIETAKHNVLAMSKESPLDMIEHSLNRKNSFQLVYARALGGLIDATAKAYTEIPLEPSVYDTEYLRFLQKVLERPTSIAREALKIICGGVPPSTAGYITGSKADVADHLLDVLITQNGIMNINSLDFIEDFMDANSRYDKVLEKKANDKISLEDYAEHLKEIESMFPKFLDFGVDIALFLYNHFFLERYSRPTKQD